MMSICVPGGPRRSGEATSSRTVGFFLSSLVSFCVPGVSLGSGGWRLQAGGWRLEAQGFRLEAGSWTLEAGGRGLEAEGRRPSMSSFSQRDEKEMLYELSWRKLG